MKITKLSAVVGTVMIITGLLLLCSCGGKEKAVADKTDDKPLKIDDSGAKIDPSASAEWPSDMFKGVPKPAFGKIERVSKSEEGGMMKFNIYYRGLEKGGIEGYVDLLKEAGWKTELNSAAGPGGIATGEKEGLGLNIAFSYVDDTAVLAVFTVKNE
jgi:hypothetical protein